MGMGLGIIIINFYEPYSKDIRLKITKGEILAIKFLKILIIDNKIKKPYNDYNTILQNRTGIYNQHLVLKEFYEKYQNVNNFIFIFREEKYKYLKSRSHLRAGVIYEFTIHIIYEIKIFFFLNFLLYSQKKN